MFRHSFRHVGYWLLPLMLVGCGGSGGNPVVTPTPEPSAEKGTALFDVDVATGKVKVVPLEAGKGKSAVLTGSAVTFDTSTLIAESGEVGFRSVKVRLKNNLTVPIGVDRPIRIQFGVIGPAAGYQTDLRGQTTVSTPVRSDSTGFADGPAGSAILNIPTAVAVGQDGSIYFNGSDFRIRRLSDGYVSTVAQNVPATGLVYLRDPASGREYLVAPCETLHSIKLIPIASGSVSTWAGLDNTSGNVNGAATAARFNAPVGAGIDVSLSQVLVADTANGAIRAIPYSFSGGNLTAGTVLTRYAGLTNPRYVCVSNNRSVGVVETAVHRIRIFNAGSSKEAIIGAGAGNTNGDGSLAQFNTPQGISSLGDTFFVADGANFQVKRVSLKNGAAPLLAKNWSVAVLAGSGGVGFADGPGTTSTFGGMQQMATDSQARLVVADQGTNGIRRLVTQGSFDFGTPDGNGLGQAQLTNPTGYADLNTLQRPYIDVAQRVEPGATIEAGEWQFSIPPGVNAFRFSVTVEAGTSVYAPLEAVLNPSPGSGSPNVVGQFLSSNVVLGAMTGQLENVSFDTTANPMAMDRAGNIYVSSYGRRVIRRIATNGKVTLVAGRDGTTGSTDGLGTAARFVSPAGLMVNQDGTEIIVADSIAQTIRMIRLPDKGDNPEFASNWVVTTIAGATSTLGDANGDGVAARFKGPFALAGPDNESVYISEISGSRIRLLRFAGGNRQDASSWTVSTPFGSSTAVGGYQDGVGSSARFADPYGLAYSKSGVLYISDYSNHRIRAANIASSLVSTVAGNGNFTTVDSDTALTASFTECVGITTDDSGAIYISDSGRIRRLLNGTVRTVAGGGPGDGTTGDRLPLLSENYGMLATRQGDIITVANGRMLRLTRKLGR